MLIFFKPTSRLDSPRPGSFECCYEFLRPPLHYMRIEEIIFAVAVAVFRCTLQYIAWVEIITRSLKQQIHQQVWFNDYNLK